jgi:hypothetical protein
MNTINKSTGFTLFQLHMGRSLRIIPLLLPAKSSATVTDVDAWHIIHQLEVDVMDAQDSLLCAKISQSMHANKHRSTEFLFKVGTRVPLDWSPLQ